MGFLSWLTGRDEKESDVYANFERVDDLITNLKKVSTENVATASDAVKAAVTALNNAKGMAQYVGQINPECFSGTFDRVASTIDQVGSMIQQKADNIKAYEESAWYEKLGSTFAMTGAKLGEGLLSIAEDLGDGVVSLVGWVAPKDSGVEEWCGEFVKKEWAHDTFNFYYNSDFAKKSVFTEDSAISGALKIAGQTAGYLFAGGTLAGNATAIAGKLTSGTGRVASIATRAVNAAHRLASTTTLAATTVAGLTGMGSRTEYELLNGAESFDEAARAGAKQGAWQAALAFGGGKLGEHMSVRAGGPREGYTDVITKAGQKFGQNPIATTRGAITRVASAAAHAPQNIATAVRGVPQTIRNVPHSIATAVRNAPQNIATAVRNVPGTLVQVATNPATPGVIAQGINTVVNSGQDADVHAITTGQNVEIKGPTKEEFDANFTEADTSEQQFRVDTGGQGANPNPNPNGNGGDNSGGGGGYYPTGGGGGGGGGGTPTTPSDTTTTTPSDTTTNSGGETNNGGGSQGENYSGPSYTDGDGGHTGGGFGEDGFSGSPFEIDGEFGEDGSEFDSMADIIAKGDKLNKIPTSQNPIKSSSSGGVSAVIPIAAGLSAAAAAGIGAKAYMDKKNNEDNGEDDEFDTDDWSDEGQIDIDYDDSEGTIADQYLNEEDDYGYQADTGERYGARSNEELAEIQ